MDRIITDNCTYKFIERLGSGAYGTVCKYSAISSSKDGSGKPSYVAIKEFSSQNSKTSGINVTEIRELEVYFFYLFIYFFILFCFVLLLFLPL